ncbi:hypothetical protein O3P69_007496 [Scylla paramamosain]|uniref:Selenoprotein N n=1 Tax=Scylla paramamosain TaxID=85552 RepID=A0AAW0V649_SCYPA
MTSARWRGGNDRREEEEEEDKVVVATGAKKTTGGIQESPKCDGDPRNGYREAAGSGGGTRHSLMQHTCPRQQVVWVPLAVLGIFSILLLYEWYLSSQTNTPLRCSQDSQAAERVVEMYTSFTPPDHAPLTPFLDSKVSQESLTGLLGWRVAATSWGWVPMSCFSALLPPDPQSSQPGQVWTLLPDTTEGAYLLSSRYVPPPPAGPVEDLLFRLLSLLHPQPFLQSRYGPRGAAAVVRAKTGHLLEVWFRVHAEFQLNIPPRLPLWFIPSAFLGQVVINTSDMMVVHCDLHVPAARPLNLDLEWMTGPNEAEDMEVTITHLPNMRVTSMFNSPTPGWTEEIPEEEALSLLEKRMYRFMEVQYHNFSEVFSHATGGAGKKLVHTVVLWGVLSDQSC